MLMEHLAIKPQRLEHSWNQENLFLPAVARCVSQALGAQEWVLAIYYNWAISVQAIEVSLYLLLLTFFFWIFFSVMTWHQSVSTKQVTSFMLI